MAWKREKGTARGYVNTDTGARISYRQYRALYVASENYRPLNSVDLARFRRSLDQYQDSVAKREKELIAKQLGAIREGNLSQAEIDKLEDKAMKVSRAKIMRDPEFKAALKTVKRLSKIKRSNMTPAQDAEMGRALRIISDERADAWEESAIKYSPRFSHRARHSSQFRRAA